MPSAKIIRRFLLVTLCWLASTASAFCQIPQFPQTLPGSTVIGRLGTAPGPTQAIPFTTLASQLQLYANIVLGPPTTVPGDFALWNNVTGSLLKDGGAPGTGVLAALLNPVNGSGGFLTYGGGAALLSGINAWTANQYFGSGVPWVDVKSGANGCAAAIGNGSTDDTAAIQCQLNWVNTNLGGGPVFLPHGNYLVSGGGLTVKGGTFLQGSGRYVTTITSNTDSTVVTFDASTCVRGAGMADTFVSGWANVSATQDTMVVGANCAVTLSRNYIWGGHHGLNTAGVDGTYIDNFICGWTGDNVYSTGANWYFSDKLDACANPSTANGFEQGATSGVAENYFYRTDLSCGTCTNSIKINDTTGTHAITFFYGTITSSPIVISNAKVTSFIGGELNPSITGAGLINITGAYAGSAATPSGGTYNCAANTNINCGPLPVGSGGTGNATQTAHAVLLGEGTSAQGVVGPCSSNVPITGQGSSTDPQCGGTIQPANGGTGLQTLTAHAVLLGEGTSAQGSVGPCNSNVPITGQGGSTDPQCGGTIQPANGGTGQTSIAGTQAALSMGLLTSCITGVNFNSANTDHAITLALPTGFTRTIPKEISIQNASHTLVTATFGLFTATGGGGAAIIAAGTAISVSGTTDQSANNMQFAPGGGSTPTVSYLGSGMSPANTIQFRIGTAEGAAATADVCYDYYVRP